VRGRAGGEVGYLLVRAGVPQGARQEGRAADMLAGPAPGAMFLVRLLVIRAGQTAG